jgi:hypothetical protein
VSSKIAEEANVAMTTGEAESEAGGRKRDQPKGRDIDEKLIMTLLSRTFSFRSNRHRT